MANKDNQSKQYRMHSSPHPFLTDGFKLMKTLSIDIETYSDVPLQKTGVYRYVESPDFEILLFAYSVDSQPVQVIDLACGEQIPKEILLALEDECVIKWAERIGD